MHRLDEIRPNFNITDWNYVPKHHNVSDACIGPIDFTEFKEKNNYLNDPWFLQAKEINICDDLEISLSTHNDNSKINNVNSKIDNVTVIHTRKLIIAWNKFSSWKELLKAIAFLKHFIKGLSYTLG